MKFTDSSQVFIYKYIEQVNFLNSWNIIQILVTHKNFIQD
jgi:hypothetical protein